MSPVTSNNSNPFRDRITPNTTGISSNPQPPNEPSTTRASAYAPPPGPPPPATSQSQSPVPSQVETSAVNNEEAGQLDAEAPPPYSLTPNQWEGESTVQYGPRRPFQQAPPPLQHIPRPQAAPQQFSPPPHPPPSTASSSSRLQPPPRHPNTHRPSSISRPTSSSYAPPPGPPPPTTSNARIERRNSSTHAPPGGYPSAPSTSTSTSSPNARGNINDGKPTSQPVPGHPFLNAGRVLIYPSGFTCYKCDNIGYKNFDPTHPCRKCWERYGKSYAGPLTYTSWTNPPSNYQRPLPNFHAPQSNFSQSQYMGRSTAPGHTAVALTYGPPPPGALVVRPGDPRIGGRLCWQCGGDGEVSSFFLFDIQTCPTCNGTGRIL